MSFYTIVINFIIVLSLITSKINYIFIIIYKFNKRNLLVFKKKLNYRLINRDNISRII